MKRFPARLLLHNRAWVANRLELRSKYFGRLSQGQSPAALWIGCCDSRVPAEEITGARPGELFVHRNIANVIHLNDPGLDSVLFYSLKVLCVPHVILCGHTHCGGVMAAIQGPQEPCLKEWLAPIQEHVPQGKYTPTDTVIPLSLSERISRQNVSAGLERLAQHPAVQEAFAKGTLMKLHGWLYHLGTGLLDPICECSGKGETSQVQPATVGEGAIMA